LREQPTPRPTPAPAAPVAAARRATPGAWRRLPRVPLANTRTLGRWDDPPDFDDDGLPDPIVAIEYVHGRTPCRAVASDHPCPTAAHDDVQGDGANGSLVAGFVAQFSGDANPAAAPDAGVAAPADGRLLGTRRVWLSTASSPHARVSTVEFSEFGPGLIVRTILEADEGPTVTDVVDVIDVFTGLGLDRRAGAIVHHCARFTGRPPTRAAHFSLEDPTLAPLVWRAITAHPYSGCATEVGTLDTALGATFTGDLQLRVQSTVPAGSHRPVAIAVEAGAPRAVGRNERNAAPWADPLALGPVRVVDMTRGCQYDRLRYERDGHRCAVVVPRSDDPLPGCETHTSPLDPVPPRPLWLHPHGGVTLDGGVPSEPIHLVFQRGGSLWETTLPLACGHGEHRAQALPWRGGDVPAGVAVSPSGERVLIGQGDDLWLYTRARRAPYLLNAPGTALPRHEVRAVAFVDEDHAAAVLSNNLTTFELTVPDRDEEIPTSLRVDADEIRRGLRAAAP
jgi:hypothetical protein